MEAEVNFDEKYKTYYILPTIEYFAETVVATINGSLDESHWYNLVDSALALSNAITDAVGEGYSLAILNPTDPNNYLLLVMDGKIVYNFLTE